MKTMKTMKTKKTMKTMQTMKTMAWAVAVVAIGALVVAELAMDMTRSDRILLYVVFGGMAVATGLVAVAALRWAPRLRSLLTSLRILALAAVVVAGGAVAAAALTMFIEPHDLTLVMVALLLGVGLGGVLAVAVAGPLTSDLHRLAATAASVGAGDLAAVTGIERNDELGAAARAVDAMTARLADSEEARRVADSERQALIVAVGHDLRTPLASMQASVEALQDGLAVDPERHLRGMATDIDHLRRLVDDLFLLARIDAGRHPLETVVVDVAELADEALEAMKPLADAGGIELRVDSMGPTPGMADPAIVGRILRNLVDNAIRHTPPGGAVTVRISRLGEAVAVVVEDDGPGFPPGFAAHAFDRFARPDDARARSEGGTGLGLAIAKELTGLSRGEIELLAGEGGRIRFTLPI